MFRRAVSWFVQSLQGFRFYRILARRLIGKQVYYRTAIVEDASALSRLYGYEKSPESGNSPITFARQLEMLEDCGYMLLASLRGSVVGGVTISRFPDESAYWPDWWIFGLLVHAPYRGAGIGENLVKMALEKASEEGSTKVNLLVFQQNKGAISLYHKMGFRPASIPEVNAQLEEEVRQGGRPRIIMSFVFQQLNKP